MTATPDKTSALRREMEEAKANPQPNPNPLRKYLGKKELIHDEQARKPQGR